MSELIFIVEVAPEGGFIARALGQSIFTEADTLAELPVKVRDAVRCHSEEGKGPKVASTMSAKKSSPYETFPGSAAALSQLQNRPSPVSTVMSTGGSA